MQEQDMQRIAAWINEVIGDVKDDGLHARVREEIREFCQTFPCPGIRV
jgi:glycine/serine hydroxymethyltransferase